jgi:hypothetical protein
MFGVPGHIFDDTEGVGTRFHVLRAALIFFCTEGVGCRFHVLRPRTHFQRNLGRLLPFIYFCAHPLVFCGTEGFGSRFHVLPAPIRFQRYRGRQVQFSCFAFPDSFSAVSTTSGPVFMFGAPRLIFGGMERVGCCFHFLSVRTRFRRYRGRRVPFSCFARPDSFSAVPRALCPVSILCAPGLIFGGMEGVGFLFHVLRYRTRFLPRVFDPVFMFCAPRLIFGVTEGVGSCFCVFCARTRFRGYRGRRVPSSCFALRDSFSTVPRALAPFLKFCVPELVFGGTEGVRSRFYVSHARTRFRRCRGRRVLFSCFARPDSFSAEPRASGPVYMFCAPGLVFGDTDGVRSRFHVIRSRTRFRRYRGRLVPYSCFALLDLFRRYRGRRVLFSCFAHLDSFSAVPRASGSFSCIALID